jgi:dTDP-4-dehydrorhamnose reductase
MNSNIIGKKILLTGVNGMLCSDLIRYLKGKQVNLYTEYFDVNDENKWSEIILTFRPDIIIHAAAITNVDFCEINPDLCFETNYRSVIKMVKHLKNEKVIFISSTGIYGNSKLNSFYKENDITNPTTVYHNSKKKAENYLIKNHSNHLILRLGWLFGGEKNHKKNFVSKILNESKKSTLIYSDNVTIGSPTYTLDVSKQIWKLLSNDVIGLFNCVNESECPISRLFYVNSIIKISKLDNKVVPAKKNYFKRAASVPINESCLNHELDRKNLNIMPNWELSLLKYLKLINGKPTIQ